jgi:hypothetical protein
MVLKLRNWMVHSSFSGYLSIMSTTVSKIDIRVDHYIMWISSQVDFFVEGASKGWRMYLARRPVSETRFSSL